MTTLLEAMHQAMRNTGLGWQPSASGDERHFCTDYELCPVCLLCLSCCKGHGHAGD
jgi:hypothetical protein